MWTILFALLGGALLALLFHFLDLSAGLLIVAFVYVFYLKDTTYRREDSLVEFANTRANYPDTILTGIRLAQEGYMVQIPEGDYQDEYLLAVEVADPRDGGTQLVPVFKVTYQGLQTVQWLADKGSHEA